MKSEQSNPLLSIVVANYNYGRFLATAIESVLSQSCQDYELIVIDGGSTDDSVDVIRRFEDRIAFWVSEKDGGQSAAFNKGFSHATGRFLTWLNADDVMMPEVIERLRKASLKHPDCEWFVGGCMYLDPSMRIVRCNRGRPFSNVRYQEGNVCVWGPSSFFTHQLLDAVGGVDERFHFMMDSDLWLRFASAVGARYIPFCNYAWGLRLHPEAKMSGHKFRPDGSIAEGKESSEMMKRDKNYEKIKAEQALMKEYFPVRRATLFSRLLSASYPEVLLSKLDTIRFIGEDYVQYFK